MRSAYDDVVRTPSELLRVWAIVGQRDGAPVERDLVARHMRDFIKVAIRLRQLLPIGHQVAQRN